MKKWNCLSKPPIKCYERDDKGNEIYPKTKRDSEYYLYDKHKIPIFIKNSNSDEIYATDNLSNEIYPKPCPFFAKNRNNEFYYAKDSNGNERYAKCIRFDMYTYKRNGEVLIAHSNAGRQIYPKDPRGNEYYMVNSDNKPFYLKDEKGQSYPTKTKKGEFSYLKPPVLNPSRIVRKRDFSGNYVYRIRPNVDNYHVSLDVVFFLLSSMTPLVTFILLCF